jgi:uncharacterized membrane protein
MNEIPTPGATLASSMPPSSLISTTLLVYGLFGVAAVAGLVSSGFPLIAPLMGIVGIVALIIAYVKRSDAIGTWVASHLRWLIRTFWFSFLWGIVGSLLFVTIIGIPFAIGIWVATTIWVLYRLVKGYMLFKDSNPIPGM